MIVLCTLLGAFHGAHALDPDKRLEQYRRQSWQIENGLPQNTVHSILQSSNGLLWMATEGGLVRFDGFDFRIFDTSNTPELHSNFINNLMQDREGALWISTSDGLLRLTDGRFTLFTIADGLPSNAVVSVYQQKSGRLIVATSGGLAIKTGVRFQEIAGTTLVSSAENVTTFPEDDHGTLWTTAGQQLISVESDATSANPPISPNTGVIQAIAPGSAGEIWIGGTNGLECLRDTQPCTGAEGHEKLNTALASHNITALLSSKQKNAFGRIWIGTTAGLALFSHGEIKQIGTKEGLAGANIQKLFEDRAGALWVVYRGGLARIFGDQIEIAPAQTNLHGILSVLEDNGGSMWFGSETAGVTVLRDQPFSSIASQEGLSADFVRTVFQDHSGTIWIGTNNGGLDKLSAGKISTLQTTSGLSSNIVLALAETGNDLWVGTPDGLTRIRDGHLQQFTSADGMADNFVRSLFADTDGSLWIGTRNGLSHLSGGVFRSYSTLDGLGSDVIGSVLRTRSGELWVGTLAGLSRLTGDRFENYTTRNGLGGDAVTTLFEDDRGSLWIGANGAGLTRLRDGRLTAFRTAKTGLPETIYGILEDTSGNLWMGSQKGVYRVAIAALNAYTDNNSLEVPVVTYGVADGMRISECSSGGHPSAWRMHDGTLWFATLRGVSWINPQSHSENIQTPQTVIEQVTLDDHPVDLAASEIVVPPGGERITIHYAGISLLAPQKVRYRYRLQGFDRGWVDAGAGRTAYYTNIPPGRYTFTVMASNAQGLWSTQPATINLRIQPRFFQTVWFYLLVAASLIGLGYAFYRVRVHYVEARYQAVMAERGRLAREIHDTLAQGYVGISIQLEIISRLLQNSQGAVLDQLNQTRDLVRSSLAEARSSIWDLRSQGEDAATLPSRLAAAARMKEHRGGPAIRFQVHGTYRPLQRATEDEILRIAQEAISNSVRHANASQIGVTLTYDAKSLQLRVSDDGSGFDQPPESFAAHGHFGLQGMQERAAAIGTMLHIDTQAGRGTDVTLRVRVQKETAKGDID
jgi:ligand-binding sensor domain-containing protein/signal transduction histidine kinase